MLSVQSEYSQVIVSLKGYRWQRHLQPGTAGDLLLEPQQTSPGEDRRHKSCCALSGVREGGERWHCSPGGPNCHHPRKHHLCWSAGRQVSVGEQTHSRRMRVGRRVIREAQKDNRRKEETAPALPSAAC